MDDLLDGLLAGPEPSIGANTEQPLAAQLPTLEPQFDFAELEVLLSEDSGAEAAVTNGDTPDAHHWGHR